MSNATPVKAYIILAGNAIAVGLTFYEAGHLAGALVGFIFLQLLLFGAAAGKTMTTLAEVQDEVSVVKDVLLSVLLKENKNRAEELQGLLSEMAEEEEQRGKPRH